MGSCVSNFVNALYQIVFPRDFFYQRLALGTESSYNRNKKFIYLFCLQKNVQWTCDSDLVVAVFEAAGLEKGGGGVTL